MRPHADHIRLRGRELYSGRKTVVVFRDCEENPTGPEGERKRAWEEEEKASKTKEDRGKNRMAE